MFFLLEPHCCGLTTKKRGYKEVKATTSETTTLRPIFLQTSYSSSFTTCIRCRSEIVLMSYKDGLMEIWPMWLRVHRHLEWTAKCDHYKLPQCWYHENVDTYRDSLSSITIDMQVGKKCMPLIKKEAFVVTWYKETELTRRSRFWLLSWYNQLKNGKISWLMSIQKTAK